MRAVRESDNAAGRCQARRPGRLLEAMCEHGPRGMAVTHRPRKRMVPYRTRLTGRLISCNEGFDADRIGPLTNFRAVSVRAGIGTPEMLFSLPNGSRRINEMLERCREGVCVVVGDGVVR